MADLAAFHFERPLWLFAMLPALVLWLVDRQAADGARQWRTVIDSVLLPHLLVGEERRSRLRPGDWLLIGWIVATIAVAGPAWQREPSPFADAKPPVAIVLKVTPSMLTEDLAPTRLDRARQKLADILAAREGASTALIAYSGSSHIVLPPTADAAVVTELAKALAPQVMPKEGDDLVGALALAERTLAGGVNGGSILLLADTIGPQAADWPKLSRPVTVLGLLPPGTAMNGLEQMPGASVIATTPDQVDVAAVARRLDGRDAAAGVVGEGSHWREAGYWLTPLLALLALLWFRRGWVLS
ncbi:VWA domain-containing protein [Bosea sp. BH3]|nr:VWA domain-containing protein [Bosea sp. BH3]